MTKQKIYILIHFNIVNNEKRNQAIRYCISRLVSSIGPFSRVVYLKIRNYKNCENLYILMIFQMTGIIYLSIVQTVSCYFCELILFYSYVS